MKTLLEYLNREPNIYQVANDCIEGLEIAFSRFEEEVFEYTSWSEILPTKEYKAFKKKMESEINAFIKKFRSLSGASVYTATRICDSILHMIDKSWLDNGGLSELSDIWYDWIQQHPTREDGDEYKYEPDRLGAFYKDCSLLNWYTQMQMRLYQLKKEIKNYIKENK